MVAGINTFLNSHTDPKDLTWTLTTIVTKDVNRKDIVAHFVFPSLKVAVPLRDGWGFACLQWPNFSLHFGQERRNEGCHVHFLLRFRIFAGKQREGAIRHEEGGEGGIIMQVTDVNKPLGSVGKICDAGNRVVFEPGGGYIENMKTGRRTALRKEGRAYKLDMWVRARDDEDVIMAVDEEAMQEEESGDQPFSWLGAP